MPPLPPREPRPHPAPETGTRPPAAHDNSASAVRHRDSAPALRDVVSVSNAASAYLRRAQGFLRPRAGLPQGVSCPRGRRCHRRRRSRRCRGPLAAPRHGVRGRASGTGSALRLLAEKGRRGRARTLCLWEIGVNSLKQVVKDSHTGRAGERCADLLY